MNKVQNRLFGGLLLTLFMGVVPAASAATLIFERALPDSTNVNNAAGANRSNVSWINQVSSGTLFLVGDDADLAQSSVPNVGGQWLIDSISVFEVANTPIDSATSTSPPAGSTPQNEFSSLTLFVGDAFGNIVPISSVYTSQFVQYQPAGLNYQGSSDAYFPVYEITFSGLNWLVNANSDIGFAVNAVPNSTNTWALHASNAALSGTPQDGFDNFFLNYCGDTGDPSTTTTATYCAAIDSNGNGFDKSSDINVLITASDVPEPATFGLLGTGLLGLLLWRKRK